MVLNQSPRKSLLFVVVFFLFFSFSGFWGFLTHRFELALFTWCYCIHSQRAEFNLVRERSMSVVYGMILLDMVCFLYVSCSSYF